MKGLYIFLLCCFVTPLCAQKNVDKLKKALQEASSAKERMNLQIDLSEALLGKRDKQVLEYARKAFDIATDLKNHSSSAQAAFLLSEAYIRTRDDRNAEVWLKTTLRYAKAAKDSDLIIKSVNKRSKLATKKRNYRKAYEVNQEAFDYFSKNGTSMSQLERNYDSQRNVLEKEQRQMKTEKRDLEAEIARLEREKTQLSSDKTQLTKQQEVLVEAKEKVEQEIGVKEEAIENLSKEKKKVESRVRRRDKEIQNLNKEALQQEVLLQQKEMELVEAELIQERGRNLIIVLSLASLLIILMAISFYARYKAKQKSAMVLEGKNKIIEEERKRSDELLLNILPAPIAEELKELGKAKARKYDNATVLLTDFKNFTKISERLSPEQLVKELDYCFRAFDFIITQHGIEKIKTIGDAYMCASGLSDRKNVPTSIIKAAIEIQEFLEDYKKERSKLGLPYFEARIGIHTGPVVAGVVGVNKFAYDIWGDTVNIASRLESNCAEGKVNISASTYNLVKYNFVCQYRGKVAAKNKGEIDMYYVEQLN